MKRPAATALGRHIQRLLPTPTPLKVSSLFQRPADITYFAHVCKMFKSNDWDSHAGTCLIPGL
jgi:hypothetical protein